MAAGAEAIATERLALRAWRPADLPAFAALNADPRVMEYFPAALSRGESDRMAAAIERRLLDQGWGLWAVEIPQVAAFIGFVGLNPAQETLGYPAVEVGWRLAAEHWGTATRRRPRSPRSLLASARSRSMRSSPSPPWETTAPAASWRRSP
jgi:hypothetical protein